MKVSEIFYSLSGEGIHAGIPTVFVRLQGCALRCSYCDTRYASDLEGGEDLEVTQVVDRIVELCPNVEWVMITGGEPLLQERAVWDLLLALRRRVPKCRTEVETSGSVDPPDWLKSVDCWAVDVKCPSSGSYGSFKAKWLRKLRKQDQLKFVVANQGDLDFVEDFLRSARFRPTALVSPVSKLMVGKGAVEGYWCKVWLHTCSEFCKEHNVRLSLQLHKILYGDRRGA